jgi:hypothetical protein
MANGLPVDRCIDAYEGGVKTMPDAVEQQVEDREEDVLAAPEKDGRPRKIVAMRDTEQKASRWARIGAR